MKDTFNATVDFGVLGKHECEIEYDYEPAEQGYNGDNGWTPDISSSCEIYGIIKDGVDLYEIVEVHFPKELEKLYEKAES